MEELVKLIAGRANISPQQAETAVDTVLSFLRQRLPEPVYQQIEGALGGKGEGGFGEITRGVEGLLDKD
jgi:hypothetical protein